MKTRSLTALIILLLAFAFCAACIGSEDGGGPPSTETPEATTTPVTTTTPASLKPARRRHRPRVRRLSFRLRPATLPGTTLPSPLEVAKARIS